jgi:uncharacterized protein (DUF58 family)
VATPAFSRALVLSAVLLVGGLFFHRGELVALAAPLVVSTLVLLRERRVPAIRIELALSEQEVGEGETVEAIISVSSDVSLDLVNIELESELHRVEGIAAWTMSVGAGERTSLSVRLHAGSWGRRFVGPAFATSRSAGLLRAHMTVQSNRLRVTTLPTASSPIAGELAARAIGFAGAHRSRLLSLGIDVAGIRHFRSGDPLRRINWHASARAPELQVTSSFGERSASVLVAIDASCDARSPTRSSLDLAVRAAAAIGAHFLDLGDSVGFAEMKRALRILRPAAGRRQLAESRRWLSAVRAAPTNESPDLSVLPVRAGQLVVALSPMVDDRSIESLLAIRRRGCALVVVDVLPSDALPQSDDEVSSAALRLWHLERSMLIARLVELGIPVVQHSDGSELALALGDLSRVGAGAHLVTR